jgi:hypothetical protein
MAGCESKQEREQAIEAERFKQEQIQKAKADTEAKESAEKKVVAEAKSEHPSLERGEQKQALPTQEKADEPSVMNRMGITMEGGKIIIDTNKTIEFFSVFQEKLDNTSREIDRELREGNLTITVPMGVEVTSEKVSIDLNKSKSFFDSWGEKMVGFAKEFDKMTQILHEDNHTQEEK